MAKQSDDNDIGLPEIGRDLNTLWDVAEVLRKRVFKRQTDVAKRLKVDRSTISRYESGPTLPPVDYLAFLLKELGEQELRAENEAGRRRNSFALSDYQRGLVTWLNSVIRRFRNSYPGQPYFRDWAHLSQTAVAFEQARSAKPQEGATQQVAEPQERQARQGSQEQVEQAQPLPQIRQEQQGPEVQEPPLGPARRTITWQAILMVVLLIVGAGAAIFYWLTNLNGQPSFAEPGATLVCNERARAKAENAFRFLPSQGVINFVADSAEGAILSNLVRSLAIDERGVWIGYFAEGGSESNGVGHHDADTWADCRAPRAGAISSRNINGLTIDSKNRVWAAAENGGVLVYDGTTWNTYTTASGLPTTNTFGITVDKDDNVWVSTWEGIAKFDGKTWTVPFREGEGTIFSDHVHFVAFQANGDIWVAHMGRGVSHYSSADRKWVRHTVDKGELHNGDVYSIAVRRADDSGGESVWFATGNGVSKYQDSTWTTYHKSGGLPDDKALAVAIDKYNRVWAATAGGVAYLEGTTWFTYHNIPSLSLAFGPVCSTCPFDNDHIWTGTERGLTHSRLPLLQSEHPVALLSVRFRKHDMPDAPFQDEIIVAPGEKVVAQIEVSPRPPYILSSTRGDLLVNLEEDEQKRFGAYPHMKVKGNVESGQRYAFSDEDNPFIAPELPGDVDEQKFTARYRVWMETRYVGPVIEITFTVRRPGVEQPPASPPSTPSPGS